MNFLPEKLQGKVFFAPMAGFSDIVARRIAERFGADGTVSEMVSARALRYADKKSLGLMRTKAHKSLYGIQLFGFDPEDFKTRVKTALDFGPNFIDINMGCPAPKITSSGAGSALMKNPALAREIVKARKDAAGEVPVSVKMRSGWDENSKNCVYLAKECRKAGAAFITVHGRTRKQMYSPPVDLDAIRRVKEAVDIPVIGNGDITSPVLALEMAEKTGCDAVMIGRGALGNPWIFPRAKKALAERKALGLNVCPGQRADLFEEHVRRLCREEGEYTGIRKARGFAVYYVKGIKNAARLRREATSMETFDDCLALTEKIRGRQD